MIKINYSKLNLFYLGLAIVAVAIVGFFTLQLAMARSNSAAIVLPVPFSVQAPTDNWSRNEDCEETSIAMANSFLNGITENKMPPAVAEAAIAKLREWEKINLGYNANTGADATTKMAEGTFGLKVKQIKNYSETDLKTELNNGHPILLPINAKILGSAQYAQNGPTYHMIVIRGFKGDTFVVNDPGTESGNGQKYLFSILQKASANWDNVAKTIDSKIKIALVVSK